MYEFHTSSHFSDSNTLAVKTRLAVFCNKKSIGVAGDANSTSTVLEFKVLFSKWSLRDPSCLLYHHQHQELPILCAGTFKHSACVSISTFLCAQLSETLTSFRRYIASQLQHHDSTGMNCCNQLSALIYLLRFFAMYETAHHGKCARRIDREVV
jgi:hypothetical protein